jgi:hypothetical protein
MPISEREDRLKHLEMTVRVVDNRTLVLGLDYLYRESMKEVEADKFLDCARTVANQLGVRPADVPVEGYYAETRELREYFRLMRALQRQDEAAERRVRKGDEFRLLWELTTSGMYGRPVREGKLLPKGWDPLTDALKETTEWTIPRLVEAAYRIATDADDWSLVGLAARTNDAVVITATRESAVLYAAVFTLGVPREYRYEWRVDNELAAAANRFIETANRFVTPLPRAEPENAAVFFLAFDGCEVLGRCVRIAKDPAGMQHYHWAIRALDGVDDVEDFWSPEIWTTTRYRAERLRLS